jgi:hypothetical protein
MVLIFADISSASCCRQNNIIIKSIVLFLIYLSINTIKGGFLGWARPGDIPGIMEYSGIDKGMTRYQRESFRNHS